MTTPAEPDWNELIDAILEFMAEEDRDERPVGLEHHDFSEHSRNLNRLDVFQWPDEWVKAEGNSTLLMWLEQEYEDWWENQAHEDDGFRGWLEGFKITVHGEGYIDVLNKKLLALYRERIVQYHPCSICSKATSEKFPYGHPDHLIKQGYPDPDIYPDGVPKGTDDIQYKHRIICDECWEKAHPLPGGRRRRRR
jgi:hypothetical protein